MGEDQDAAGARRLDEAQRGDGLAGAGGVLEPEALGGVGILGLLLELARPRRRPRPASPGALRPRARRRSSSSSSSSRGRRGRRRPRRSSSIGLELGGGGRGLDVLGTSPLAPLPLAVAVAGAGPRRAARSACPTARRPGGPRGRCRRRGGAPPRRAGARARAAARTHGAIRSTASCCRRRPRPARRRARGDARTLGPGPPRGSRLRRRSARASAARRARSRQDLERGWSSPIGGWKRCVRMSEPRREVVAAQPVSARGRAQREFLRSVPPASCPKDNGYLSRSNGPPVMGRTQGVCGGRCARVATLSAVSPRKRLAALAVLLVASSWSPWWSRGPVAARPTAPTCPSPRCRPRWPVRPAVLAALHAQANELLAGGTQAFHARLHALRGYPVVVNKWASWCGPCQTEFPAYQRASVVYGRQVAFVGIDGKDQTPGGGRLPADASRSATPATSTPTRTIARAIQAATYYPQTVYFDRAGQAGLRPRRPLRERRGPGEGHPAVRAAMTGALTYEVRRVRGDEEMAAALALRHEVFCVEQGVPDLRGARRPRWRGRASGRRVQRRAAGHLPAAVRRPHGAVQPPGGARVGAAARASPRRCSRSPTRRPAPAAPAALVLHAQTYARALYEAAGYEPRGRIFMEAGIEHIAMEKYLS